MIASYINVIGNDCQKVRPETGGGQDSHPEVGVDAKIFSALHVRSLKRTPLTKILDLPLIILPIFVNYMEVIT